MSCPRNKRQDLGGKEISQSQCERRALEYKSVQDEFYLKNCLPTEQPRRDDSLGVETGGLRNRIKAEK